jgi:hypothetical protein
MSLSNPSWPGMSNTSYNATDREEAPPPSYQPSTQDSSRCSDISQRIERKLARYNTSQNVFKRWLFEIISWTTSAICMVSRTSSYCRFVTFLANVAYDRA